MRFEQDDKGMEALRQRVADICSEIVERGFQVSQESCPEDEGTLIASGEVHIDRENMEFNYYYTAPHAPFVEFGTAPHWAPPWPIYEWCRRRLQLSGKRLDDTDETADYLFKLAFGRIRKRLSEAERAFIGIYRKIGIDGTDPHPFMRPSVEVLIAEYPEIVRASVG